MKTTLVSATAVDIVPVQTLGVRSCRVCLTAIIRLWRFKEDPGTVETPVVPGWDRLDLNPSFKIQLSLRGPKQKAPMQICLEKRPS